MSTRIKRFVISSADQKYWDGNGWADKAVARVYDWADIPWRLLTAWLLIIDANPESPEAIYLEDPTDDDDIEKVVARIESIWVDYNPSSLDELLLDIKAGKALEDWTDMPTFGHRDDDGFELPYGGRSLWSWDKDRVMVGNCADDMEIITWEEFTA